MKKSLTIPRLAIKDPKIKGELKGKCIYCGKMSKIGLKIGLSNTFTAYSQLFNGNLICEYCWEFIKTNTFRSRSWIATQDKVNHLKRLEILNYLLNPPKPPFAIYITKGGKKQGWMGNLFLVNYNSINYWIITDWSGAIYANKEIIKIYSEMIKKLREVKISKTSLTSGSPAMKDYERAIKNGLENEIKQSIKEAKNPLWEVIVYVSR